MREVESNGIVFEFPDETPNEVVARAIRSRFGIAAPPPTPPEPPPPEAAAPARMTLARGGQPVIENPVQALQTPTPPPSTGSVMDSYVPPPDISANTPSPVPPMRQSAYQDIVTAIPQMPPAAVEQAARRPDVVGTAVQTAIPEARAAVERVASGQNIAAPTPVEQAETVLATPPKPDGGQLMEDVGAALRAAPRAIPAALEAFRIGGAPEDVFSDPAWGESAVAEARRDAEEASKLPNAKQNYVDFLGIKVDRQAVRTIPQNLAFSVVSMGASLLGGLGAGIVGMIGGPGVAMGARVAGAGAAGGVAAYRMDTNGFMHDLRRYMDKAAQDQMGRPLTDKEFVDIAQAPEMQAAAKEIGLAIRGSGSAQELARAHGLYEAVPEAAGNLIMLGAGKYIIKEALKGGFIKPALAVAGGAAGEVATEVPTQMGQTNTEIRAGISRESPREWTSAADWWKSFEEVAGPTLLTTGLMGGAGGAVVAGARGVERLDERFRPGAAVGRALEGDIAERGFTPASAGERALTSLSPEPGISTLQTTKTAGQPATIAAPQPPEPVTPVTIQPGTPGELAGIVSGDLEPGQLAAEQEAAKAAEAAKQAQAEAEAAAQEQTATAAALGIPEPGSPATASYPSGETVSVVVERIDLDENGQPEIVVRTPEGQKFVITADSGMQLTRAPEGDGTPLAPVQAATPVDVRVAAGVTNTEATGPQKLADNYRKGRFEFAEGPFAKLGSIAIETPKGGTRTAADGSWSVPNMPAHYGHLSIAEGADGDKADVFIGDDLAASQVYVIDQINPETGKFDETKSMVSFPSRLAAVAAYVGSFSDGKGAQRIGAVTAMPAEQFVARAQANNLKKAVAYIQPEKPNVETRNARPDQGAKAEPIPAGPLAVPPEAPKIANSGRTNESAIRSVADAEELIRTGELAQSPELAEDPHRTAGRIAIASGGNLDVLLGVQDDGKNRRIWFSVNIGKDGRIYDGTRLRWFEQAAFVELVNFDPVYRMTGEQVQAFGREKKKFPDQSTLQLKGGGQPIIARGQYDANPNLLKGDWNAAAIRGDQEQVGEGGEGGQPEVQPSPVPSGGNLQREAPKPPDVVGPPRGSPKEDLPPLESLANLPRQVGRINGKPANRFDKNILKRMAEGGGKNAEAAQEELNRRAEIAGRERTPAQKTAAERAKRVDIEKDSLLAAIAKMGGIDSSLKLEVGFGSGENKWIPGVGQLFRVGGNGLDNLAVDLSSPDLAFMLDYELESDRDNGGVNLLTERIRNELGGKKHWSFSSTKYMQEERDRAQFEAEQAAQGQEPAEEIPEDQDEDERERAALAAEGQIQEGELDDNIPFSRIQKDENQALGRLHDLIRVPGIGNSEATVRWIEKPGTEDAAIAEEIAKTFGKTIIWVEFGGGFSMNGVMLREKAMAKWIFVSIDTKHPYVQITGHELVHHLRQDRPDLYKQLHAQVSPVLINDAEFRRIYGIKLGASIDAVTEEMIGDVIGTNFTEPDFWAKVAQVAPEKFKALADAIIQFVQKLINRFTGKRTLGAERFVSDMKVARDAVAKAMADYAPERKFGLTAPTEAELKAREDAVKAAEEKPKEPPGKKVTVDQIDLFNTQGSLFSQIQVTEPLAWPDAPRDEKAYVRWDDYEKTLVQPYVKDGAVIANSRVVPNESNFPPVGSWRIHTMKLSYGREIEQLVTLPVEKLMLNELDSEGRLDPTKAGDDARYAKWIEEGKRAPPIEVVQTDSGKLSVTDGHRRVLAAKRAGKTTIEAWVNYAVPIPSGSRYDGKPDTKFIRTGLTFEMLTGEQDNPYVNERLALSRTQDDKQRTILDILEGRVDPLPRPSLIRGVRKLIKFVEGTYRVQDLQTIEDRLKGLVAAVDESKWRKPEKDRQRGPLWLRERIIREQRTGGMEPQAAEFALWLLEKSPQVADGLGISIRQAKENDPAGRYDPYSRVATAFLGNMNETTAVHEILHHTERMMPDEVRDGIVNEWMRQLQSEIKAAMDAGKKNGTGTERAVAVLQLVEYSVTGSNNLRTTIASNFARGVLKYEDYQFASASEFWAVNATEILRARRGTWVQKAIQWLRELVQKAKAVFGLQSSAPVIYGLQAVLNGSGKFTAKTMLAEAKAYNATAYHGTPHIWPPEPGFPHGRPRLDKIGTGEGAQAYGWGWYSAESQGVGKDYQRKLSPNTIWKYVDKAGNEVRTSAMDDQALRAAESFLHNTYGKIDFGAVDNAISYLSAEKRFIPDRETLEDGLNLIKNKGLTRSVSVDLGSLYRLDIPDDALPKLLDWDRPLSEQTKEVRDVLLKNGVAHREDSRPISAIYGDLASKLGSKRTFGPKDDASRQWSGHISNDQAASEYLASIGIPGNKYLDQGSRGIGFAGPTQWQVTFPGKAPVLMNNKPTLSSLPEGTTVKENPSATYNFVIWDQKVLDRVALLERNGEKLDAMREEARFSRVQKEDYTETDEIPATEGRLEAPKVKSEAQGELDLFTATPIPGNKGAKAFATVRVDPVQRGELRIGFEKVDTPEKAAHAFAALRKLPREGFQILVLDKDKKPIAHWDLFRGTITQTSVYPREVAVAVFQTPGAAYVWYGHNHPSGVAEPSQADELLTRTLNQAVKDFGVKPLGHIIIAGTKARGLNPDGEIGERFDIPPASRKYVVPIMERVVRMSRPSLEMLSSPSAARQTIPLYAKNEPGLLLLDARHRVLGWWPMTVEEMGRLKTGNTETGGAALFRAIGQFNAAAAMAYLPNVGSETERVIQNVGTALSLVDVQLLDAFSPRPGAGLNVLDSFAERGLNMNGSILFSRKQIDEVAGAATEAVKERPSSKLVFDMGALAKIFVHPRTYAAFEPDFTHVKRTQSMQYQLRDEIVAEIAETYKSYRDLNDKERGPVHALLELGRLAGEVYGKGKEPATATNEFFAEAQLSKIGETITLTDRQKAAYWSVRRAMDKALDRFIAELVFEANLDPKTVKTAKQVLASIKAGMPPIEKNQLKWLADKVEEIHQAKRRGYIPFTRFGNAGIAVTKDDKTVFFDTVEAPEIDFRNWRRDRAVDKRHAEIKAEFPESKGFKVVGPFDMVTGSGAPAIDMAAFDQLMRLAQVDDAQRADIEDRMKTALKKRGFRKHFLQADNIAGYSVDFERALAEYTVGLAGYLARRRFAPQWDAAIGAIPAAKGQLTNYAREYRTYINSPVEELQFMRQTAYVYYLAAVPATAVLNLSQVPLITIPYLNQFINSGRLGIEMTRAYAAATAMIDPRVMKGANLRSAATGAALGAALGGWAIGPAGVVVGGIVGATAVKGDEIFNMERAPKDMLADIKKSSDDGFFVPLATMEMMGTAYHRQVAMRRLSRASRDTIDALASMFTLAERHNRIVTYIAAYRLAKLDGMRDKILEILQDNALAVAELATVPEAEFARAFAEFVVLDTQYEMGKGNRPTLGRGWFTPIVQFKGFPWQTVELYARLLVGLHGNRGRVALLAMMVLLLMASGLWGLPFAENSRKTIEELLRRSTDIDKDLKLEFRRLVADLTGSARVAEVASAGGFRYIDDSPDVAGRVSMGNILPNPMDPATLLGVPFDLWVKRAFGPGGVLEQAQRGDTKRAVAQAMPNFVKNWIEASAMKEGGVRSQKYGNKIVHQDELRLNDLIMKGLGARSRAIAEETESEYTKSRASHALDEMKRAYTYRLAVSKAKEVEARNSGDKTLEAIYRAKFDQTRAQIKEWNKDRPAHEKIIVTAKSINNAVEAELMGAAVRNKRAPRQMRGVRAEIEELFNSAD